MAAKHQSPIVRQIEAKTPVRDCNREERRQKDAASKKRQCITMYFLYIQILILYPFVQETSSTRMMMSGKISVKKRELDRVLHYLKLPRLLFLLWKDQTMSVCCNQLMMMMYRKTVQQFKEFNYDKAPNEFVMPKSASVHDKQWICKTCHSTLKRGVLPAQAKGNNLDLDDIPEELSDLNPLEIRLISLRIPFMKMVALPCGKQRAMPFMGQLSMSPLISPLCVPFCQGFHLRPRWFL